MWESERVQEHLCRSWMTMGSSGRNSAINTVTFNDKLKERSVSSFLFLEWTTPLFTENWSVSIVSIVFHMSSFLAGCIYSYMSADKSVCRVCEIAGMELRWEELSAVTHSWAESEENQQFGGSVLSELCQICSVVRRRYDVYFQLSKAFYTSSQKCRAATTIVLINLQVMTTMSLLVWIPHPWLFK